MTIYYFNIDLMYVLKARLFILENQLKDKLKDKMARGNFYVCPHSRINKCTNRAEVDEINYETGRKNCVNCGAELVHN